MEAASAAELAEAELVENVFGPRAVEADGDDARLLLRGDAAGGQAERQDDGADHRPVPLGLGHAHLCFFAGRG